MATSYKLQILVPAVSVPILADLFALLTGGTLLYPIRAALHRMNLFRGKDRFSIPKKIAGKKAVT